MPMAAMSLMNDDIRVNICRRPHKHDFCCLWVSAEIGYDQNVKC
jgi:hypothetical protein